MQQLIENNMRTEHFSLKLRVTKVDLLFPFLLLPLLLLDYIESLMKIEH